MRGLYYFGVEGHRILRKDELYIAGPNDVRFRENRSHAQDIDNPDYWEAKVRFFRAKYEPMYEAEFPPIVVDPESPEQLQQNEIDRAHFRLARKRKFIEAWVAASNPEQQISPHTADNHSVSQHSTSPLNSSCLAETNTPPFSQACLEEIAAAIQFAIESESRAPKRKRSHQEYEGEHSGAKRCFQARPSQEVPVKAADEPRGVQTTSKNRSPSHPVALRRSPRIAASPKKRYI
ncbi:hypothetical protein E0Z10_g253 [Xylaria hypoxylon]|uniref:Uncharacterized protein n=1 Tax=Xylaria hypoxylon TaxID=37992 RepID=A0A4Z0YVQ6_9PEZI|nr:hypothetical protein E0Z10_g253 [Xylaria hypoxylon]